MDKEGWYPGNRRIGRLAKDPAFSARLTWPKKTVEGCFQISA
jgi:hypothetical protein